VYIKGHCETYLRLKLGPFFTYFKLCDLKITPKPTREAAGVCSNVQINHLQAGRALHGPLGTSHHISSLDHVDNLRKGTWEERLKQRRE